MGESRAVRAARKSGGGESPVFDLDRAMREHSKRLFAYAYAILGDWHEAEDAVQEAFCAAWRGRADFDGRAALAWLYRITLTKCVDIMRSRGALSFAELPAETAAAPSHEGRLELMDALSRLPDGDRALVLGRALAGEDYAELASRLGISEAAARKRYERAKKRLARLLSDDESEV